MKRGLFALLLGLIFIIGTTAATSDVPETITLKNAKGDVVFPHKAHHELGYKCKECHHTLAGDMDVPTQKCRDCHTADSKVTNKDAFHGACVECHKNYKKEHSDTKAPTTCSKCHAK
jgi:hypothetical protein